MTCYSFVSESKLPSPAPCPLPPPPWHGAGDPTWCSLVAPASVPAGCDLPDVPGRNTKGSDALASTALVVPFAQGFALFC